MCKNYICEFLEVSVGILIFRAQSKCCGEQQPSSVDMCYVPNAHHDASRRSFQAGQCVETGLSSFDRQEKTFCQPCDGLSPV